MGFGGFERQSWPRTPFQQLRAFFGSILDIDEIRLRLTRPSRWDVRETRASSTSPLSSDSSRNDVRYHYE